MNATDVVSGVFPEDQRTIEERVRAILEAARAKDFDRLASYHLDHPKFSKFDDFEPLDRQDSAAARQSEEEAFGAISNLRYRLEGLKVDVFGPVAISTFVLDYAFEADGDEVRARARSTLVFVNDHGDWKIAHEHFSPFKSNP